MLAAELVDQLQHLLLVADVQGAGRLVEQQQGGALGERPGQEDPLPLAPGEGGQLPAAEAGQVETVQDVPHGGQVGGGLPAQRRDERGPAEQHVVEDRHAGRDDRGLGDGGHHPGAVAAAQRLARRTEQGDGARRGQQAADGAQQGRLAGAVRADHGDPPARLDAQVDAAQHRRAAQGDAQVPHLDGGRAGDIGRGGGAGGRGAHVSTRRAVRRTRTKNGPPSSAVTTPIGISAGAAAVRATTSVSARNAPPKSRDSGRITR
ncbi:hypothetical protein C5N14_13110 [Micromonospora sp. MW-13]|nr:hypothetical protein C5N14_13110 [Micromonospora sp. MW-13]